MNQLVLSVPAISCGHCVKAIAESVGEVPGVGSVAVDFTAKTVVVTGAADPTAVRAAIAEAGYEATE
ncbi:heavy-metal-associated domain-containing protein [Microbispora sp. KK1-11]|uniref:heavy-metal-associated domain-containing protein n=1 Tax=Microbispora sp. KK1-11 TaxID=2053005 RepID=UPI00115A51A1|nr:heavy metal-associated domain-containing protein [Microbispora sp. KK1-11]TQS27926.1 heavy-metal-associated domain-containing protein [Microbispora sp. KK1-11]